MKLHVQSQHIQTLKSPDMEQSINEIIKASGRLSFGCCLIQQRLRKVVNILFNQGRRRLSEIGGAKLKTGGGKVLTVNYCSILRVRRLFVWRGCKFRFAFE